MAQDVRARRRGRSPRSRSPPRWCAGTCTSTAPASTPSSATAAATASVMSSICSRRSVRTSKRCTGRSYTVAGRGLARAPAADRRRLARPTAPTTARGRCEGAGGRPINALHGFAVMLLALVRSERPRAVLVCWDTLDVPTYRHRLWPRVPVRARVRSRDRRAARAARPSLVTAFGFAAAKAGGYEADDLLAAGARDEAGGRRHGARGHLRPRRLPARHRPGHGARTPQRRLCPRPDRAGRGRRALRRAARAGARLHRAARRPVRQAAGRPRHRREGRGRAARPLRQPRGDRRACRRAAPAPGRGRARPAAGDVQAHRDDGRRRPRPAPGRRDPRRGGRDRPPRADRRHPPGRRLRRE